jgi:hypothetical protein
MHRGGLAMADFLAELKRRHIYRVAAAYAVVAWVLDRMMDHSERGLEAGLAPIGSLLFEPVYAPLRKMERFKTYIRNAGLVAYWRERGWPDLCRPMGAGDFECD